MSAGRFRFVVEGVDIVGPVQGCGGFVSSLAVLEGAARFAADGFPTGLYEPRPGCVAVFPQFCAMSDGPRVIVPISTLATQRQSETKEGATEK